MSLQKLCIGKKPPVVPIIQGGMGVGVSLSSLAGAVAKEGGIGIISTAQIGFEEPDFEKNAAAANLTALERHIKRAKEIASGAGMVGVNVMVALKHYAEHVRCAVQAGADVIISGAGLPLRLPEYVEGSDTAIAPIVSSARAAEVILKMWSHKYKRTADFLVIEGPKAGGHLGFSREQLDSLDTLDYDTEIRNIIEVKKKYETEYQVQIPVVVAGGIFDHEDILHAISLGADGVQIASRFVATEECDASPAYKDAYIRAKKEDIQIVQSPVGMPGRALRNAFIERVSREKQPISRCYGCLEKCNPANVPYCITKALIDAVKGNIEDGLVFVGDNVDRIHEIVTVHELMQELCNA